MKVAYDHQVFGLQRHGGISRYFSELVRHLARRPGVETSVIAPFHMNGYLLASDVKRHVRGGIYLPYDFRGNTRVVGSLNSMVLPAFWGRSGFDVVHETYYSKQNRGRCRLRVLTIYDMIHELYPGDFPNSAMVTEAKRAAAFRADHIICISETTRQDAIRMLGINPTQCSVIYLGCSLNVLPGQTVNEALHAPCILYVGPRSGYKNFSVVLDAYSQSQSLKTEFSLVAFGGKPFSATEHAVINKHGLTGRVVRIVGDDALLRAYYRAAAVFVYPSKYEGFGIPPLEAMANDCPVVCSNAGSISEILGDAADYFEADNSEKLRALLEQVTSDAGRANELRLLGRRRIESYSWNKCAVETFQRYQQLLSSADKKPLPSAIRT